MVVGYAVVAVHPPTLTNGYISTSLLDLNSVQGNLIKNFLQTKSFEFPNSQNFDPCGPILIKVLLFAKNTSITINFSLLNKLRVGKLMNITKKWKF